MKDNAFEIGRDLGYDVKALAAQWGKVKPDAGAEPTPAMLAAYDAEALLAIGVARPLARAWGGIFVPSGAPRGRKFKAEKARSYSPADLVAFIVADPKAEGLRAEYMRRTGGTNALFVIDGKIAETETADRIQRLFDRDPVAPFVVINGKRAEPVGYPEDAAKEDREDPYQRGVALGQPGDVSGRLGVSLDGVANETRQAIACAVEFDLSDATRRDLQADATSAKAPASLAPPGATLAKVLAAYQKGDWAGVGDALHAACLIGVPHDEFGLGPIGQSSLDRARKECCERATWRRLLRHSPRWSLRTMRAATDNGRYAE